MNDVLKEQLPTTGTAPATKPIKSEKVTQNLLDILISRDKKTLAEAAAESKGPPVATQKAAGEQKVTPEEAPTAKPGNENIFTSYGKYLKTTRQK